MAWLHSNVSQISTLYLMSKSIKKLKEVQESLIWIADYMSADENSFAPPENDSGHHWSRPWTTELSLSRANCIFTLKNKTE